MVIGAIGAVGAGGTGINIVISAIDNFSKTFAVMNAQLVASKKHFQASYGAISRAAKIAGAVMVGASVLMAASAIKSFASFEEQMINSMNMFDDVTTKEKALAKDLAITLSKELGMSANETAKAFWFFGSAGMNVNETLSALPEVLKFAKVNLLDTGEASSFAMTAMKVFGVEAKNMNKLLDEATFVMKNAKMNMSDLAQAMSYVGPVAANLGIEFSDLSVLVGVLADAGISGSRAGTVLRMAIMKLTAPTGQAKDLIEEMGINVFDAQGKFRGIFPVLKDFETQTKNMTDKQREFAMKTIFGVRQVAGMNAILKKGIDPIEKYAKEVKGTTGTINNMFEEIEKGTKFQLDKLNASWGEMKITLGEALIPVLEDLIKIIKPVVEWFTRLSATTKRSILVFTLITGAVLLLVPVIITLTGYVTVLGGAFTKLATKAGIAHTAILGPVGIAIALTTLVAIPLMSHVSGVDAVTQSYMEFNIVGGKTVRVLSNMADEWNRMGQGTRISETGDAWVPMTGKVEKSYGKYKKIEEKIEKGIPLSEAEFGVGLEAGLIEFDIKVVGNIPEIPGFQEGGIMPHTGLAYLHKGETIIPSNSQGRGGLTLIIEGNIYGTDPDEMAEALQDKLDTKIT